MFRALLILCTWQGICGLPFAATNRVGIGDDCDFGVRSCFSPSELTIHVGDSVEFFNYADTLFTGAHNVVADDGSFRCAEGCDGEGGDGTPVSDSICNGAGFCVFNPNAHLSFIRTFAVPGVVRYHDEVTKAAGTIIVKTNQPISLWVDEIYTNLDGSVQFIELSPGPGAVSLGGQKVVAAFGSQQHTYTFPHDLPNESAAGTHRVLLATQGFADLHLVKPDFIMPNGFLFAPTGWISTSDNRYLFSYTSLPVDGKNALYTEFDADIGAIRYDAGSAVALNNADEYAALAPVAITNVIEYYNAGLDDFFLTSYPEEIGALDSGQIAGWQRTGYSLPTWSGPPVNASMIPGLDSVCRVLVGTSHFFSLNGCADAMAIPGSLPESGSAFFAMLPDLQTGSCPSGQLPVYRLWNPRGTAHRYTTHPDVRQDMLNRGYVSEGYGSDGVAMCVPDSSAP